MNVRILAKYVELCEKMGVIATFEGLRAFAKNFERKVGSVL